MFCTIRSKGFSLIGWLVVIVIVGLLAAIIIPRYMVAKDRARISAAEADAGLFRQALGMFEIDNRDYPAALTIAGAAATLVDPQGNPYISLPTGDNFADFTYTYDGKGVPTTYAIEVTCKDNGRTVLVATPEGILDQRDIARMTPTPEIILPVSLITRDNVDSLERARAYQKPCSTHEQLHLLHSEEDTYK